LRLYIMTIGDRIREKRKELKFTQKELAKKNGLI
jgi:transcriptional regulator with XRE-family HTH domain